MRLFVALTPPNAVVDELTRRLNRAAARHPPLSLAFGGGGRFGHRVLWTGVRRDVDGLRSLADSVRAAARRSRLPVEQRPYHPHLTLARSDGAADLRPLVERLAPWEGLAWVATARWPSLPGISRVLPRRNGTGGCLVAARIRRPARDCPPAGSSEENLNSDAIPT